MKVLMFGWEFPPHISGGVGTACYGMTRGLSTIGDLEIIFVVPKAHGNEYCSNLTLIYEEDVALKECLGLLEKLKELQDKWKKQGIPYFDIGIERGVCARSLRLIP